MNVDRGILAPDRQFQRLGSFPILNLLNGMLVIAAYL